MSTAARQSAGAGPLLVLDTNVVLDWVAFADPRVQPIAAAIESGAMRVVSSAACVEELQRTLAYAQVKLAAAAQAGALARYRAHVTMVESPAAAGLPRCEDPDDQKFLELAWHAGAGHLLTRDKALLKLAPQYARRFAILAPDVFLKQMGARAGPAQAG